MQSLPEFFCGKFPHKNPATYLDYRNYIIKLYRESPNAYLSATVCRKNLAGDVCSIIRLHAFLEHWGLINFNVQPHLKPTKLSLGPGGNLNQNLIDLAVKGFIKMSEAEALQKTFSKQTGSEITNNPTQNVLLIASKKISVLTAQKRPACNFCGNICDQAWYSKKPQMNSQINKEDQIMKQVGESDSLHQALRRLTQTYILCRDCFSAGNFPKILDAFDFEKQTLEGALKAANFGYKYKQQILDDGGNENEQPGQYVVEWSIDEKYQLIEAVAAYSGDWESISKDVFEGIYSPEECAMQFLSLPISETLLIRFQTAEAQRTKTNPLGENAAMQTYVPTVFQDISNPLLSQLAIFAKSMDYLEHHESQNPNPHPNNVQTSLNEDQHMNNGMTVQESHTERRTTRKQKKEVLNQDLKGEKDQTVK